MKRLLSLSLLPCALLLTSCEFTPSHVNGSDIDDAFARGQHKTVCKGLDMRDDEVRRYATTRLEEIADESAVECVCSHTTQIAVDGTVDWDKSVLKGLTGSENAEMLGCFAALLDDPAVKADRPALITALATARVPAVKDRIALAAEQDADGDTRVSALKALTGSRVEAHLALFMKILNTATDPALKVAAVEAMAGNKDEQVVAALSDAAENGESGALRGAALKALKRSLGAEADSRLCDAMMNDADATVRASAIGAYRGTKRPEAVACLRKRALTKEEESSVRQAVLDVLKSSPTDEARAVLCDGIPFFLRTYVIDDVPDKIPGTNIVKAQNDVDWDASYDCFQKAYKNNRGYSCYAKQHIGLWFREVGGKTYVPKCAKDNAPTAGAGVVSFE
jgi:HEAT repeat protein